MKSCYRNLTSRDKLLVNIDPLTDELLLKTAPTQELVEMDVDASEGIKVWGHRLDVPGQKAAWITFEEEDFDDLVLKVLRGKRR